MSLPATGPTLVREVTVVAEADGTLHRVRRPVVALCQCGLSRLGPWCDNTHKMVNATQRTRGADRLAPR